MSKITDSITINGLTVKNRLVMPPMASHKGESGKVTGQTLDYYEEKTKGGYIGLVITEHCYVSSDGIASLSQLSVSRDSDIDGLSRLADLIHKNGSRAVLQISHAGSCSSEKFAGFQPMSASAVVNNTSSKVQREKPREMTRQDIERVTACFADAAVRAKKAGFDGAELHAAHAYLLNQFYSPIFNKRRDEYGGNSLSGRIKFHLEAIKAVREAAGNDFLLALRLGGCDYTEGGSTIEDAVNAAAAFEAAGLDLLDISGGTCGYLNPLSSAEGYFSDQTEAIKKAVSIPVILTGGIVTSAAAGKLLAENKADLTGAGRAILKDSNWAENFIAGRV